MPGDRSLGSVWLIAALLTATVVLAYTSGVLGLIERLSDRERRVAGDVLMTNPDAYFFLRGARDVDQGKWTAGERDLLRHYPDGVARGEAPWPSRAIAFIARVTGGDVYLAGLYFSFVTSGLFVLPLLLYATRVGWPAAGIVGALTGVASVAIRSRTSLSRMESDGLILFAFWGICLIFALLRPEGGRVRHIAVAAGSGLAVALTIEWYPKTDLIILFACGLVASALACGLTWRRTALLAAAYLLVCNPFMLQGAIRRLFDRARDFRIFDLGAGPAETSAGAATAWTPLEFSSIQVQERMSFGIHDSLTGLLDPAWLAALGLLCFVGWAALEWRRAVALLPIVVTGLLGFRASRFLMFLAPLAGFGLGALVTIGARRALRSTRLSDHTQTVACVLGLLICLVMVPRVMERPPMRRWIPLQTVAGLQDCAEELPPGSVVWHSWGYGFLIQDVMGAATHTDGGEPDPVIDHLLARAVSGSDERLLQNIFGYLSRHAQREVVAEFRDDYPAAYQHLLEEAAVPEDPSFVVFTSDSISLLPTTIVRGQWHPETGRPNPPNIASLRCERADGPRMRCSGGVTIDLARGFMRVRDARRPTPLSRLFVIEDGRARQVREYEHESGLVLEVLEPNAAGVSMAYALGPVAYASIVNRAFLLGDVDEEHLELVCDRFPVVRMYRVRNASPTSPATAEAGS